MGLLSTLLVGLFTPSRRWSYRRLLVVGIATALRMEGLISGVAWAAVAVAYVLGDALVRVHRGDA